MATLTRRYRSQTLIAHVLITLAVFMALPVEKPALWLMDMWGDVHVPMFLWPAVFGSTGAGLLLTRSPRLAMGLMVAAFTLLGTVAGAAYLTQGANALTVVSAMLMLHAVWTAIDLKAVARGGR